ncbi:MAG: hypothetical protein JNK76_11125 [Planctomycetales bacterium]|nr:hypothetical protein [Planctomycetales bacterium]MBN8628103.1 hypothetical protein [Planctomycetota bacterium]
MSTVTNYLSTTAARFGDGWNRFWYLPSHPLPAAVLRIGTGLIAFWMLLTLGFDLLRYFGPFGIVRVSMLEAIYPTDVSLRFSYLDFVQDSGTLQAVHYAGLAIVLAFTLGLWAPVTSILSLVVFLSYFHRGRMLTGVDEPVVAMLLFYLCFAPTGACLSLDAWLKRRRANSASATCSSLCDAAPTYTATIGLRLIQVHLALIYFMMFCATLQYNAVWWNGTAVWWLIARPESALVDLRWLYQYPYLINFWTTSLIFFYLAFALLIWNRHARPLLVAISAIVWTGTAILTGLIPFCAAMFVAGLAFISAEQWKSLGCCKAEPAMPKAAA